MASDDPRSRVRGPCRQADRAIGWQHDTTVEVLRNIDSADGMPGLTDSLLWQDVRLFDAHEARGISGEPGTVVAQCDGALARATVEGAVWIGHVRSVAPKSLKLAATKIFVGSRAIAAQARMRLRSDRISRALPGWRAATQLLKRRHELRELQGTSQRLKALLNAYRTALARATKVLLLTGGRDYWSNGIHLAEIEPADSAADESWRYINAIDDFARAIIETSDRLVISVVRGNAGAGGVFLSLAADEVWASDRIVLNPHYKDMGNLYGWEYWTYLLPRRAGAANAAMITQCRLPIGVAEAGRLGIVDRVLTARGAATDDLVRLAAALASDPDYAARLVDKRRRRAADEAARAVPQRGAAPHAAQLLRLRSKLPRGALQFHSQGPEVAYAADRR